MLFGRDPTSINLFSGDMGKTFNGVGCGPRNVDDRLVARARAEAGFGPDQKTQILGSAVVGVCLSPPVNANAAYAFAETIGCGLLVERVNVLAVEPMGRTMPTVLDHIPLRS